MPWIQLSFLLLRLLLEDRILIAVLVKLWSCCICCPERCECGVEGFPFLLLEGLRHLAVLLIHIFKQDLGCSIPFHGNLEKRAVQVRFCSCSSEQLYVICCFLLYNVDVQGLDVKKKKRVLTFDWFGSYLITLKRWIRSTNHLRNEVGSKLWNGIKDLFFCFVVTYLYFIYLFMWVFWQFARTTTNPTTYWTSYKPNEHIKHRRVTNVHKKVRTRMQRKGINPFHR